MGSLVTVLGIGMVALPSGILASAFSEQMRRKRESLQWVIEEAMEDGDLDTRELNLIRSVGDKIGLSDEQIEDLVEHSKHIIAKEKKERAFK